MTEITAKLEPPSPIPPRPTMYALAFFNDGAWVLRYGGYPHKQFVETQQKLHPGSMLVVVPGEGDQT